MLVQVEGSWTSFMLVLRPDISESLNNTKLAYVIENQALSSGDNNVTCQFKTSNKSDKTTWHEGKVMRLFGFWT